MIFDSGLLFWATL